MQDINFGSFKIIKKLQSRFYVKKLWVCIIFTIHSVLLIILHYVIKILVYI